jgi:hypothetical protein
VSWARDAVAAILLIEDRMETLTAHVRHLADGYTDLDRRLVRQEDKFDLIEKMAAWGRRPLPARSRPHTDKKKTI